MEKTTTNKTETRNYQMKVPGNFKIKDNRFQNIQLKKLINIIQKSSSAKSLPGGLPLMLTSVTIRNTRTGTDYDGQSGNQAATNNNLAASVLGNFIDDNLFGKLNRPAGMPLGRDQYSCAEPHAFSQFIDDESGQTRNLIPDLKTAEVDDPDDGGHYKPPCGWCEQWIGGNQGNHNIMKWFRPQPSWLKAHTNW